MTVFQSDVFKSLDHQFKTKRIQFIITEDWESRWTIKQKNMSSYACLSNVPQWPKTKRQQQERKKSRIISSPLRQASLSCYCILNICPQKGWKWAWKRRWEFKKMTTARVKGVKESSCRTLQASKNRRETVTAQCCSRLQLFTPAVRATRRHNEPSCCLCEEIQRRRLCPTSGPPTSERVNTTELRALFKDTPLFRPALRSGLI